MVFRGLGCAVCMSLGIAVCGALDMEAVCPTTGAEIRYGEHYIPKQVYYTGRTDGHLRNLTYGPRGMWPADFKFVFFDNTALDRSMQLLDEYMRDEVAGLYDAFRLLRPWAYRADLWRYCILWACGGIYVDSKLALAVPFYEFLWNAGFNPESLGNSKTPQLLSCRDDLASATMHRGSRVECLWQGLLIAEPGSVVLLKSIKFVVSKIQQRWYPTFELSKMPWLFLTGPGAIAVASQVDNPTWRDHVKLNCLMMYTNNKQGERGLQNPHLVGSWSLVPGANHTVYNDDLFRASFIADNGLHESQRTNDYGKLFKSHMVYVDDERRRRNSSDFLHPGGPGPRGGHAGSPPREPRARIINPERARRRW